MKRIRYLVDLKGMNAKAGSETNMSSKGAESGVKAGVLEIIGETDSKTGKVNYYDTEKKITPEEAKFWSDKRLLDDNPNVQKDQALLELKVKPENFDRWIKEKNSDETAPKQIPKKVLQVLKNPNLFKEITEVEFNKKIVGEIESRKVIFLCASGGRLVENCQIASYNLLVNDDSGIGKDYLVNAVLFILPKEFFIHKTRISPAVFTYWHNAKYEPEWTWNGKVFYPEDISENVLNSDVFKVMCSSGSSATIIIKQRAYEIDIEGKPVMITTTATATPNPELTRRFIILNLDSSENQTKAIMKRHSEFKKRGIVPEYNPIYTEAMKHLKRVKVKIPFADLIDVHFPSNNIIMRTNYPRFLDFISASCAFHQYQRKIDSEGFLLAEAQDYNLAKECFEKVTSNKFMIPLTINQKKILAVMQEGLKGSVTKLHNSMPFLSEKGLQTNLQNLARYGILETATEKDTWNRDITCYSVSSSYDSKNLFSLPTFEEICRNTTISTEPTIPILPTIATAPKKEEYRGRGTEGIEGAEPRKAIPEFNDLLKHTQVLNDEEKAKPQESKGVYDDFSLENFVKSQNTHHRSDEEKTKPQENNPALDESFNFEEAFKDEI